MSYSKRLSHVFHTTDGEVSVTELSCGQIEIHSTGRVRLVGRDWSSFVRVIGELDGT